MVTFLCVLYILLFHHYKSANREITIYTIANLNDSIHISITAAQWLAVNEINNHSKFLSDYTLKLVISDNAGDASNALINTLSIIPSDNNKQCQSNTTTNNAIFPIVLSGTKSSISALTTSVLNVFNFGQIGSSSTSTDLADTHKYPYFYRTIPSDSMQANGLILLCKRFNWTKIALVYIHDTYGLSLSLQIHELATANDTMIDVTSIAIAYEEGKTYNYAANQIRQLQIFIIIAIIHSDTDITAFFQTFDEEGMLEYPYYLIGVDSWIHSSFINTVNTPSLKNKIGGFIGCTPWQSNSLKISQYDSDVIYIINKSIEITSNVYTSWTRYQPYSDNDKIKNLQELEGNYMVYAYDAMYTIAHVINIYENKYSDYDLITIMNDNPKLLIERINEIIVMNVNFTGATGEILFDENGERINGLFAFGNTLSNSSISYFGYFYQTNDGKYKYKINENAIVWPHNFTEKGIIPHSHCIINTKTIKMDHKDPVYIFSTTASIVSIVITIVIIILLFYYRENQIIKAASVYLNIFTCFGCIIGFVLILLFGIDEKITENTVLLTTLCNIKLCMVCISYTMIFMPMFVKLYRLSRIFNEMLEKTKISDGKLFVWILLCLLVDIILLAILFLVEPLQRIYIETTKVKIDALQSEQNGYMSCHVDRNSMYCIVIIIIWKLFQYSFGFSVAINVARISGSSLQYLLARFDETGMQLFIIIFTFILVCISATVFILAPILPTFYSSFLSIILLIIINLTLWLTVCPRLIAVIRKKENKYQKSAKQKLKEKLRGDVKKILKEEEECRNESIPMPTKIVTFMTSTSSEKINYAKLADHIDVIEPTDSDEKTEEVPINNYIENKHKTTEMQTMKS